MHESSCGAIHITNLGPLVFTVIEVKLVLALSSGIRLALAVAKGISFLGAFLMCTDLIFKLLL